jgi:hypothetical protein
LLFETKGQKKLKKERLRDRGGRGEKGRERVNERGGMERKK